VNSPETPLQPQPGNIESSPEQTAEVAQSATLPVQPAILPSEPDPSMQEYYQLQQSLLKLTLILTGIIFVSVWIFYSLNIALNYLIGACTGVVYLRLLARNVAQLGREKKQLGKTQLGLIALVIAGAALLDDLQIVPVFLGFLTYKAAVIFYMLQTTLLPDSK
jgi:ATP synthase protein I